MLNGDEIYYRWLDDELKKIEFGLDYKFITFYKKDKNLISSLCDKYGSDKGEVIPYGHPYSWNSHSYTDFYLRIFSHCRLTIQNVFECGIGTNNLNYTSNMSVSGQPGASLRVWRDYFPNADIYGGDIDRGVLFNEDRINTFYVDQLDPNSIGAFWAKTGVEEFDIMIDDGLHTFAAGSCLFTNSINFLRYGGIYIIEDVITDDLIKYKKFFEQLNYYVEYIIMFRPNLKLGDNTLVVIRKL